MHLSRCTNWQIYPGRRKKYSIRIKDNIVCKGFARFCPSGIPSGNHEKFPFRASPVRDAPEKSSCTALSSEFSRFGQISNIFSWRIRKCLLCVFSFKDVVFRNDFMIIRPNFMQLLRECFSIFRLSRFTFPKINSQFLTISGGGIAR